MSAEPVSALPLGMASLGLSQPAGYEPNWIDYRHSLVVVDKRRDGGEEVVTCAGCGCEADVSPVPHSPKCPAVSEPDGDGEAGGDGLDLLERMDAGEPLTEPDHDTTLVEPRPDLGSEPGPVEEPQAPTGLPERGVMAGVDATEEEVAHVGGASNGRLKWTREKAVAAIREIGDPLGRAPSHEEMRVAGYGSIVLSAFARRYGTTWRGLVEEAGFEPRARREQLKRSGREPQADPSSVSAAEEPPSRPATNSGRRRAWEPEDVLAAIRRWAAEYGQPPTSTEWMRRIDGYPTTSTVAARFGSWANAIEQAGFERPTRGGVPLRPLAAPAKRIKVRGTGLTYRTPEEAYLAAEEIEADGERVAEQARFDGDETKAEQAVDQSRDLAEKIRQAAHAFEDSGLGRTTAASGAGESRVSAGSRAPAVEEASPVASPKVGEARTEVTGFQRAIGRALVAGMRAAADALEAELEEPRQ